MRCIPSPLEEDHNSSTRSDSRTDPRTHTGLMPHKCKQRRLRTRPSLTLLKHTDRDGWCLHCSSQDCLIDVPEDAGEPSAAGPRRQAGARVGIAAAERQDRGLPQPALQRAQRHPQQLPLRSASTTSIPTRPRSRQAWHDVGRRHGGVVFQGFSCSLYVCTPVVEVRVLDRRVAGEAGEHTPRSHP